MNNSPGMQDSRLTELYELCVNNTATEAERSEFIHLMTMPVHQATARKLVMHALTMLPADRKADLQMTESVIKSILSANRRDTDLQGAIDMPGPDDDVAVDSPSPGKIRFYRQSWFRYAAAIVFVAGAAAVLWKNGSKPAPQPVAEIHHRQQPDVGPGGNKAILTLGDGRSIVLDSATDGMLAQQGNARIIKLQNGQIVYNLKGSAAEAMTNTMTTPRGGQYQLRLPDGTQVWLNAISSITYPTAFTGRERNVKITGEVYFEVKSNPKIPFRVQVNESTTIEVLGTHFNVDSYEDAGIIKTTLLEGSIRTTVQSAGHRKQQVVLNAGQQARIRPSEKINVVSNVDVEKVMAWKNGLFNFENASLQEVMQQVARWYNIEVVYEKGVPDMNFGGEISRNVSLAGLLNGLQKARVHFRIEAGRRLVVMP